VIKSWVVWWVPLKGKVSGLMWVILEDDGEVLRKIKVCPEGVCEGLEGGGGRGVLLEDWSEETTCGEDRGGSLWEDGGGGWMEGMLL